MLRTQQLPNPLRSVFGAEKPVEPVWPQAISEQPVRHPSRFRPAYKARGHTKLDLAGGADFDEAARLDIKARELSLQVHAGRTAPAQAAYSRSDATDKSGNIRLAVVRGVPVLGIAVMLVGYTVFQNAPMQDEVAIVATSSQATVAIAAPQITNTSMVGVLPTAMQEPPVSVANIASLSPPAAIETASAPQSQTTLRQPTIVTRAPAMNVQPVTQESPIIASTIAARPTMVGPRNLATAQPSTPFTCAGCVSPLARFENITIALHSEDPSSAVVKDVVASLTSQDVVLMPTQIGTEGNQVRFYRAQDAGPAQELARRYDAVLIDLTWFGPGDDNAKIDLFLATPKNDA